MRVSYLLHRLRHKVLTRTNVAHFACIGMRPLSKREALQGEAEESVIALQFSDRDEQPL